MYTSTESNLSQMANSKEQINKKGYIFTPYEAEEKSDFERLLDVFQEIIVHASGDVDEALDWMNQLDREYKLFSNEYTMDDFVEDLKKHGCWIFYSISSIIYIFVFRVFYF